MGKLKKTKRSRLHQIKKKVAPNDSNQINPFEIHKNREKFKILGRKNKHDHGLPGVSRGKAIKKRKETLGKEYKIRNKNNKFLDHRIHGNFMNDELSNIRFAELQKRKYIKESKSNIFNLNDEEVLTHKGQTLKEIEEFRNEVTDESEEDEALDANFTKLAHFGGGEDIENERKTAIEDMIIESKKRKIEIMKDRDEILQMTSKLDDNYKDLLPQLGKLNANNIQVRHQTDEYDKIMREMIFEPRGEVTDRLRSEEEIMKSERIRLEKLENERLLRMKGEELETENKPKHKSADDLDDWYLIGSDEENNEKEMLTYDSEGKSNIEKAYNKMKEEEKEDQQSECEESQKSESEEELVDDDSDVSEENDDLADLKEDDSSDEDIQTEKYKKIVFNNEIPEYQIDDNTESLTTEIPLNLESLSDIIRSKNVKVQVEIIEKIIQYNHPKFDSGNRFKLGSLFSSLLQYINDIFMKSCEIQKSFQFLDLIMPHLFDIAVINTQSTTEYLLKIIKEHYEDYKKNVKILPGIETIVVFKIVCNLYSTSDFRHPIVTPTIIFISHILTSSNFKSRRDISLGLLLVGLVLEMTSLSKRFLPATFAFLLKIINLAISEQSVKTEINTLKKKSLENSILFLTNKNEKCDYRKLNCSEFICNDAIDDKFKILSLNMVLELVQDFGDLLNENVGGRFIAAEFSELINKVNIENYPEFVKANYIKTKCCLESTGKNKLSKLVASPKNPKALRLLEPKIEKIYDDKRRRAMTEEKKMRAIMIHKVKQETKGAEREIRRDNQFLNKIKIKQQIKSDLERKEKVKRIFAEASIQQGELNALQRQRKKTKF